MAIFMLTIWYPFDKDEEVTKKALQFTKLPPYIKKWQAFGAADGKKGLKSYNIIYAEPGKVDEAMLYIAKVQSSFTKIEGYCWKAEPLMSMRDYQKLQALQI